MEEVRISDFAGSWYPGSESECRAAIKNFSNAGLSCPDAEDVLGGIVPHAGWFYSGQVACNVIKCLSNQGAPETCVIFGRHLHPESPCYIMKKGLWETPLGSIEIDMDMAAALAEEFSFIEETPSFHEPDNTIELQLPFIKYFFPETKIVPIGVPPNSTALSIAKRAAGISKKMGRRSIALGSTDLTHYGLNYGYIPEGTGEDAVEWVKNKNDRRVVDLMLKMDGAGIIQEALQNQNACCSGAAGAAAEMAKGLGADRAEKIKYLTSYDIRPDSSFVGYAGVVFIS
ncbi:MAG: AmmeMemoRadiSam system protein B [Thermoprotei archaeon]|nr:MAG: AmmeMemoRadiSam system protein B [Thermoprotei archaeon]